MYESPDVLRRVWTVHEGVVAKNLGEARGHLQNAAFDIGKRTFLYTKPPVMERCDGHVIRSSSREINWTLTTVNMKCRGMVVMSENNAPGWIALVDGQPPMIYDAYTTLRGVVLGAGRHTIEMRYRPVSVMAGAAATLLAMLAGIATWIVPVFRRWRMAGQNR